MILKDGETSHVWCQETGASGRDDQQAGIPAPDWCCIGSRCMAWRWMPFLIDDEWVAAVAKAAKEIKDTTPGAHKAAKHVNENRAKYGLPTEPTHGYCGKAGVPQYTKVVKA